MCQRIIRAELEEWQPARAEFACGGGMYLFLSQNPGPQFPSRKWDLSSCSTSTLGVVGSQYPGHFQKRETPELSQNAPCQQTFAKELGSDLGVSFLVHTSTLSCNTFRMLLRCFLSILTLSRVALPNWVTMSSKAIINPCQLLREYTYPVEARVCWGEALGIISENLQSHCSPRSSGQRG